MEKKLSNDQVDELKTQLDKVKKELEVERSKNSVIASNSQDNFIETLIEKGGQMLLEYSKMSSENQKYTIDKESELEKEELKTISQLDKRDKYYKGILIGICIVALILAAVFVPKAEIIIPVLSLIIGLLFKTNSLSDFFSHRRNKYNEVEEN